MSDALPSTHVTLYGYGNLHPQVLLSFVDLVSAFHKTSRYADLRMVREDALISRSRSRATQFFLESDKDVWLQLDHDIEFQASDVLKAVDLAHTLNATVCIPYSCRGFPPRPALRADANALPLLEYPELSPIHMFASGCLAIPRNVVLQTIESLSKPDVEYPYRIDTVHDTMIPTFPTLWMPFAFETLPGKHEYLSEDYAAALRISLAGFPHYQMQPTKPLRHWGEHPYQLSTAKL
jgi:hypothetical protein